MRYDPGSEYYRQKLRLPKDMAGLAFVFCWGVGFGSAVLMAPLPLGLPFGVIGWGAALGALYSAWRQTCDERRGIEANRDGLIVRYWLRDPEQYAWSEIKEVAVTGDGAVIRTDRGEIALGTDLPGWPRLVKRIQERLAGASDAAEGEAVSAAEVAGWLGIREDEGLFCHPPKTAWKALARVPVWLLITGLLTLFYAPFFYGAFKSPGTMKLGMLLFTTAHASIFFGVFSGGLAVSIVRDLRTALSGGVVADVSGISVGGPAGWHHYRWSELHGVEMVNGAWQVTTTDGSFVLPQGSPNLARLVNGIRQAVRERKLGRRLPELEAIPAGAISLTRDLPSRLGAERGLSVSDDQVDVKVEA